MNSDVKRNIWLSFSKNLKEGICTSYHSDNTIVEDEPWPEVTSALLIEGLTFKPTTRDQYLLRCRPMIHKLFEKHHTKLSIYGSSNPIYETEDENSRMFYFAHAGREFETSIHWSLEDPLTLSRILNDVRNASSITVSIEILCSDRFFDLSDLKFQEVDEYGQLEVHQHEINIKRIQLSFE